LIFTSPSYGKMSLEEMTATIREYIEEQPEENYKVVIGTDSQTTSKATTFVTALIIHRKGKGARFFYRKEKYKPIPNLAQRIYKETELSLKLIESLKKSGMMTFLLNEWPLEIHLDIGQRGKTRKLIQEVVAWVTSVGYVAKIKPYSYGASYVADKFTS
jgi:predicted RNase H-related nuclease YkuK (DUF458 family)